MIMATENLNYMIISMFFHCKSGLSGVGDVVVKKMLAKKYVYFKKFQNLGNIIILSTKYL